MTNSLRLSGNLSLPLDVMSLATVVYGARGSGKTTLGAVLAEEVTKQGQRFCAIDLKGDWYGLKSSADGKSDGIPVVVFGGDHADVPLEDGAGSFVGETVAGLSQSVILDFEHFTKGRQVRFLTDFFLALYHHNRDPLLLLADEAQRYAPQKAMDPDAAKCLGAVEDVVKLGRKHGLGVVLFTQRGSGLNKEASELCGLLVAFRTPGPLDQDRIRDWLDANTTREQRDAVMTLLAKQPTGTAVFASGHPELALFGSYAVRRRETFDSSRTPKIGQRRTEPKRLATPDLDALRTKMSAAIERQKADDPKALRSEIARLRKELASIPKVAPVAPAPPPVEASVLTDADRGAISALVERLDLTGAELRRSIAKASPRVAAATRSSPVKVAPPFVPVVRRASAPRAEPSNGDGALTGPERRILNALAWMEAIGVPEPEETATAFLAGYTIGGGAWNNPKGRLRGRGLIDYKGDRLALTEEGRALAETPDVEPTNDALHAAVRERLPGPETKLLDALLGVYPDGMTNEDLAAAAGYAPTGGAFNNPRGRLRSLGLIEKRGDGLFAARAILFPENA